MSEQGEIVIVSGLPGAGKSTLAREMAGTFERGVHLEVDKLRSMFVAEVINPSEVSQWSEAIELQFRLERQAAGQMASLYATQGFKTIIDDVMVPPYMLNHYQPYISDIRLSCILLNPSIHSLTHRLKLRKDIFDDAFIDSIPGLYDLLNSSNLSDWSLLDSSNLSREETLREALSLLNSRHV